MKPSVYVARTFFGLEEVLASELRALGAQNLRMLRRAVEFEGDLALLYKANYTLRTAIDVLYPLVSFTAQNENALYRYVFEFEWEKFFSVNETFAIDTSVFSETFTHSKYAALKVKDAIADRFRQHTGQRPSVDVENPDFLIHVHIYNNEVTLSLNSSGEILHKRGYRKNQLDAPLNEVLAAAMLLMTGYDGSTNFTDPMCGSGTLLIEAAMIALNIPAGYYRQSFGFQRWRGYKPELWLAVKKEADAARKEDTDIVISGSDISVRAIEAASANVAQADLEDYIRLSVKSITEKTPPKNGGLLVTNPPYGERLKPEDIRHLYKLIGDTLKQKYKGYTAWVLTSNPEALKAIGLRTSRKITLMNGALECRFAKFDLY